ncbi:helix-turn-helix domain-containing protein [Anaeromicropila populeti]|uniref:Stage 0 sporulation protein A homolog n=1 Tax=Anaeromicropila populeti TaxID=37658 RepID=A0A1I6JZW4_9FIRM|nr:helix-turn-helix domain-containing protein [Anaeromicropila populeti]SFR84532.1 two-component system, response regulator YesN [Anaeromicropila populeti]
MYKIMLADDEGIVIDSLRFIINKNFPGMCEIEHADTGRKVIELAENFKPDIAFMDIQMPGINGIEAMKEIRKTNSGVVFIVMTAFDKFNYAKEAINLGVLEYLTKPVNHTVIVKTLEKAMKLIEDERKKRSNDLMIREKLEIVVPILESDFIYAIIAGEDLKKTNFPHLLGIGQEYGMILVIEFGDSLEEGVLTNPVGVSVKAQSFYPVIKDSLKEEFTCIVGPLMVNKIVTFLPHAAPQLEYDQRIHLIEKARKLIRELRKKIDLQFKIGIGSVTLLDQVIESYKEALKAVHDSKGRVVHICDLQNGCEYEKDYPIDTERRLFHLIEKGDLDGTRTEADRFFDWMINNYPDCEMDIKLKVLEFVLFAEQKAFLCGGMIYYFRYRKDYLDTVTKTANYELLRKWYIEKITEACQMIGSKGKEQNSGIILKAKEYMEENYKKDISLDEVSRIVDISPYYFSKLFKEETGENFIEYLTNIRIEVAKKLLRNSDLSIKNICMDTGYSDPNYFSRIFKKQVGVTPTEYRERGL